MFEDNAKGEVVGVRSITLSLSCDLSEIYLVDGLKHNFLSIIQLCNVWIQSLIQHYKLHIKHETKDISIVGDRVDNIYVLNNIDLPTLTCLIAVSNKSWLWYRKLGHASMPAIEKLSRLERGARIFYFLSSCILYLKIHFSSFLDVKSLVIVL